MRLAEVPRVRIAALPTPLQHAPRLSEELGVELLIKRDDLTGLGAGGNKVRKLEYLVADALACGADALVTGAGPQSNHAALTALAAGRAGLSAHLVFYGHAREGAPAGNGVLTSLAGADITWTGDQDRSSVDTGMAQLADELRAEGRRPYVIPRGGATPLGCVGYVRASLELAAQLAELGVAPARIVVSTGSCGTQAGLEAGARWLQAPYAITGVTVSRPARECEERVRSLAVGCAQLLGLEIGQIEQPEVLGGYLAPGYGKLSAEGHAAMQLLARTEGLLLDPVFTAKAMAALVDLARDGAGGPIVFWHTGGAPTALMGGRVADT